MIEHLEILKYIPCINRNIDAYAIDRVINLSNNIYKYQSYRNINDIIKVCSIGVGAEIQFCKDINIDILKQKCSPEYHDFVINNLKIEIKHVSKDKLYNNDDFLVISRDAKRSNNSYIKTSDPIQASLLENKLSNKIYDDTWHIMCIYTSEIIDGVIQYTLHNILDWYTYKSNYGSLVGYSKRKDKNNEIYVCKKLLYKYDPTVNLYDVFFKICAKALENQINNPIKKNILVTPLLPFNM